MIIIRLIMQIVNMTLIFVKVNYVKKSWEYHGNVLNVMGIYVHIQKSFARDLSTMWLGCLGFLCCYWGDVGSKSIYLIGIRITWDVAKTNYDIPVVIKLIKQLSDVIEMVLVYHRLLSLVQIPSHIIIFISTLPRAQARMDWILYKPEFRLGCSTLEEADYTILYNQYVLIC